jgi:hypothetical protein
MRQECPGDHQVAGGIAHAEPPEVQDGAETAVDGEEVAGAEG